ncbi:MAG: hypothetical protein COT18_07730 [Elusimicrobia bacterium CG08_land_8_20_14_0_20_59_10]|nr:MAG: hypothetical protein COT18_07730 [Elusimicrobia bacterium CG08_land_8_20_14_0_20_59_10]
MKKKMSALLFVLLFSTPLIAAAGDGLAPIRASDISGARAPQAPRAVTRTPLAPKNWTVLYYSTSKDALRYSLMWQLLEMKKTGSTAKVNVVVQAAVPVKHADGSLSTTTYRIALGAAGDPAALDAKIEAMFKAKGPIDENVMAALKDDIIWQQDSTDTGDWRAAADFTKWAKTYYPARRYVFMIYGHGNGFFDAKKTEKGTLLDTDTMNYVTLPEMRLLMAETGHVDAFIMTSCIMQMGEVAWQIKDYADVIVGSSELMWSVGYDVAGMLAALEASASVPSEKLASQVAGSYVDLAKQFKLSGAHASVIRTSQLSAFGRKLDAWVDAELALNDRSAIDKAIPETARFDIFGVTLATSAALARSLSISGDLYDFVSLTLAYTPQDTPQQQAVHRTGRALMDFIAKGLVYKYYFTGTSNTGYDFSRAHGLSVHVPPVKLVGGSWEVFSQYLETDYWTLPFAKETKWGAFLNWLYGRK